MKRITTVVFILCLCAPGPLLAQGSTATRLKTSHEGNVHYPQLSPDGTMLAYEVNVPADKKTELYWAPLEGTRLGTPEKLVPESMASTSRYGAGKRIIHGFAWAAAGQYRFAYSVSDSQGTQDIYIDNWSQMVESPGSANKNPTWDPGNGRFVFSSGRTGNGDLYLWDGDQGGAELQLTFDDKNGELYPSFDQSGSKVAFVRAGRAGSHIMVLDVNMFTAIALVQWEGSDSTRPAFSPDSTKVAFFSNKGNDSVQEFGLWVTDARPGGSPRNIAPKAKVPSKGTAQWTPDGKGVIAVLDDPDAGDPICIFPVDGGAPTCLDTGTKVNRDPYLSLVGSQWRLIFTAQERVGDDKSVWQELYVYDIPR